MTRTNRGGSMLSFAVVAMIMAGVLIGGVYAVRRLTAQPSVILQPESRQPKDQSSRKNDQHQSSDKQTPKITASTPSTTTTEQASQLPQTGTEDVFSSIIALGFISVTFVSYVRSRHPDLSL